MQIILICFRVYRIIVYFCKFSKINYLKRMIEYILWKKKSNSTIVLIKDYIFKKENIIDDKIKLVMYSLKRKQIINKTLTSDENTQRVY